MHRTAWLALTAGLLMTAGSGIASAQTVVVRNAPAGASATLVLNDEQVATATADAVGNATLRADMSTRLRKVEAGVHVIVDSCGEAWRILLVENGVQPAPVQGACTRATVRDVFSIQPITTLVIEVDAQNPAVWIRQGPAPVVWLGEETATTLKRTWKAAPVGIIVSAGVGGANFENTVSQACGDAVSCVGESLRTDGAIAATYWLTRFVAADVAYLRPGRVNASGSGTNFSFTSGLDARMLTIDGKVAFQAGPVRLYGLGGVNRLSATSTTVQTIPTGADTPETFAFKAQGWGWLAGGGAETWITNRLGLYVEGDVIALKGGAIDNAQGSLSDTVIFATTGVRVAVGRSSKITAR